MPTHYRGSAQGKAALDAYIKLMRAADLTVGQFGTLEALFHLGPLCQYEKGGVEVIKDDPRNYVFSNVFEVASKAKPYEKVAVGKNIYCSRSSAALPAQPEFGGGSEGAVEAPANDLAPTRQEDDDVRRDQAARST